MKRKLLYGLITIFFVIVSVFIYPSTANAVVGESKQKYLPIKIYATNQLNQNEIYSLQSAISEWNSIGKGQIIIYGGVLSGVPVPKIDMINTVGKDYFAGNLEYARTVGRAANGYITECDIVLNTNSSYASKNLKSIFMHELGHCLGLDDNTISTTSIMYLAYSGLTSISSYDIQDINYLYP